LREPSFPSLEFDKLQKQKLAEAQQMRDDTDSQASIAFRRAVYSAGNPQYRLTSDERIEALNKATVGDVKAFHGKSFGPAHMTMVVVGDVDTASMQSDVGKAFEGWKGGLALPAAPAPKAIKKAAEETIAVPGKESVSVIVGEPTGLRYADADYLPLAVGTNVLGHGFTSRLLGIVRDKEGLTYTIQADLLGSGELEQTWCIYASYAPSLLNQGTASTRRELATWQRDGITTEELDFRKSALAGEHRVKLATSGGLADMILNTVRRGLPLSWIDDHPKQVSALTLKQVNDVIRRHVDPDKLVTVRAGTIKGE
jgi:zinc protease